MILIHYFNLTSSLHIQSNIFFFINLTTFRYQYYLHTYFNFCTIFFIFLTAQAQINF